ncbi:MAG TPA: hypothetical protein VJB82_04095 [Candidatus Peribacterales bacterium]|nr:hypothetical protein [Candidatus Peribacterales bacterium]
MKKLNIIVNGFDGFHGQETIKRACEPFTIGTCISIQGSEENLPTVPCEKLIWEYPPHMWKTDWNALRPLDEEIIEKMAPHEMVFIEMMERDENKGRAFTYRDRRRRYLRLLRYWNHMIEEYKIDVFLSCTLPHRLRTYVIYAICRVKKIPTILLFHAGPLADSFICLEHWEDFSPDLERIYKELRAKYSDEEALKISLSKKAETYFQQQLVKDKDPPPPYYMFANEDPLAHARTKALDEVKENPVLLLQKIKSSIKNRLKPERYIEKLRFWYRKRRAKKMFAFYEKNVIKPDLSAKYVYVPLHHQPECSTCPMAGAYSEQMLVVQMLHALLPPDVLLYVKEHPHQEKYFPDGRCRDHDFFEELLTIPRVRFISRTFSTYQLASHAAAVATGTGMVAFESLFRGIPIIMFGHWSQQYAPGVFRVHTVEDCKRAIHAIFNEGAKPRLPEVRLFFKALDAVSLDGYLDERFRTVTKDEQESCIHTFSNAIKKKLIQHFGDTAQHP